MVDRAASDRVNVAGLFSALGVLIAVGVVVVGAYYIIRLVDGVLG